MANRITPHTVMTFIPNLIGYGRFGFLIASMFYMQTDCWTAITLYWLSAFLDAFDGMAARHFNQCSQLGAVLDMLCDRIGTCMLIMGTIVLEPYRVYAVWFQLAVFLDIVAHWAHMYSSMMATAPDGGNVSHKAIDLEQNAILHYYYQKGPLFIFCSANELFFMTIYLLAFVTEESPAYNYVYYTCVVSAPLMAIKQVISGVHLYSAAFNIALNDCNEKNAKNKSVK